MTPEKILSYPAKVLRQKQRKVYFEKGYLLVERIIPKDWVERLIAVTHEMVERNRNIEKSNAIFDLEPGHTRARSLMLCPSAGGHGFSQRCDPMLC